LAGQNAQKPWEYPYSWEEDPEAEEDRREINGPGPVNAQAISERAVSSYWTRCAEHADRWLQEHTSADQKSRDRAFGYRLASRLHAESAGGLRSPFCPESQEDLRIRYEKTKNPVYLWRAFSRFLHSFDAGNKAPEIPEWFVQPLRMVSAQLATLGLPGMPAPTAANIKAIMGLTKRGTNAVTMAARQRELEAQAEWIAKLNAAGLPVTRARAVAYGFRTTDPGTQRRKHKKGAAGPKGKKSKQPNKR
jgi:hypothetical protein